MGKGSYRRRGIVGVAVLAGLIVLGFALRGSTSIPETGLLDVDLPDLGDADCRAWDAELYRVLVLAKDGKVELRLSYEPADGGPRVRLLGPGEGVPRPAEPGPSIIERIRERFVGPSLWVHRIKLPAVAVAADGDTPWVGATSLFPVNLLVHPSRLYLAGRSTNGSLGAIRVGLDQYSGPGLVFTPSYGVLGVRVLRPGPAIRLRDAVDAVRSTGGKPRHAFLPLTPGEVPLHAPDPEPPGAHRLLQEAQPAGSFWSTIVLADGTIHSRGRTLKKVEDLIPTLGPGVGFLLRADEAAPWSVCRRILTEVADFNRPRQLCFAPENSTFWRERHLTLPDVPGGRRAVLRALPDATAGDMFREILRLVEDGAEGIDFE